MKCISAFGALMAVAGTAHAAIDCDTLKHSTQPFEMSIVRTYSAKDATATREWSKTVREQVYRSADAFDFTITITSDDVSKLRSWNGLPLELHTRRGQADYRTSMRYDIVEERSYAGHHDFDQVFATEFSNPKTPGLSARGVGTLHLQYMKEEREIRLAACSFPVIHYRGETTTHLEGHDLGRESMEVLYSPDLRQPLLVRLESDAGSIEERAAEITTDFVPKPHPGY